MKGHEIESDRAKKNLYYALSCLHWYMNHDVRTGNNGMCQFIHAFIMFDHVMDIFVLYIMEYNYSQKSKHHLDIMTTPQILFGVFSMCSHLNLIH